VDINDINAPDAYWRRAGLPRSPRDSMVRLDAADSVQFVTMPALRYFDQVDRPFDLIFLDGDHSATAVYQEISCALAHLCDGGTVVIHDYFPRQRPLWNDGAMLAGPSLAVERCQRDGSCIVVRPLRALPWPTKLGSNVTSLALMTRD